MPNNVLFVFHWNFCHWESRYYGLHQAAQSAVNSLVYLISLIFLTPENTIWILIMPDQAKELM